MIAAFKELLSLLWNVSVAMPDLIQLVKTMQKRIDEEKLTHKVTDDLKVVKDTFHEKDASKLTDLFSR